MRREKHVQSQFCFCSSWERVLCTRSLDFYQGSTIVGTSNGAMSLTAAVYQSLHNYLKKYAEKVKISSVSGCVTDMRIYNLIGILTRLIMLRYFPKLFASHITIQMARCELLRKFFMSNEFRLCGMQLFPLRRHNVTEWKQKRKSSKFCINPFTTRFSGAPLDN